MLGTKDKVLLGISTVVGVITAIWAGGPGKMYGGCGGSEVVILSTAAQIFITVVKFAVTMLGSGAAAYVLGLCVTGAYSKLSAPKPPSPLLASGYRAKLGYFKFIRFCTNGLPTGGTVVLLASTVVFGVVAISTTLKSKLYCPVDSDAAAVMSLLAGLSSAAAAGVIVYHLLVKFGYNDGAGPNEWGKRKIESMLPSMIQYTPLWATMRALYNGDGRVDMTTSLKSSLPLEFTVVSAGQRCGTMQFRLQYKGKTVGVSLEYCNLNIYVDGENVTYLVKEYECLASLMPLITDKIRELA